MLPQSSFVGRSAFEIPKPKDWQLFERLCVLLFQNELNDSSAKRYGRGGQDQQGIDILARRDGHPEAAVGIQCRHVAVALTYKKILSDCRAALELEAGLKEIIFATTAPNCTRATDAAVRVEKLLRSEGYQMVVDLYGWDALQELICRHDAVYDAWAAPAKATDVAIIAPDQVMNLAELIAGHLKRAEIGKSPALDRPTGFELPISLSDASCEELLDGLTLLLFHNGLENDVLSLQALAMAKAIAPTLIWIRGPQQPLNTTTLPECMAFGMFSFLPNHTDCLTDAMKTALQDHLLSLPDFGSTERHGRDELFHNHLVSHIENMMTFANPIVFID